MTINDYYEAMSNNIGVAELKSHLSHYLRRVRKGERLTIYDRQTPIAELMPINSQNTLLNITYPKGGLRPCDIQLPKPLLTKTASLTILLQQRADR